MPFCKITLKAPKPLSAPYPRRLITLGEHLRKRRLDLKLLQKEVANKLGVSDISIKDWENNHVSPSLYSVPKIIKFLGYIPDSLQTGTFGEKIVTSRKLLGLTQKKLAHRLGIDPSTLGRWERDKSKPSRKLLKKLKCSFEERIFKTYSFSSKDFYTLHSVKSKIFCTFPPK